MTHFHSSGQKDVRPTVNNTLFIHQEGDSGASDVASDPNTIKNHSQSTGAAVGAVNPHFNSFKSGKSIETVLDSLIIQDRSQKIEEFLEQLKANNPQAVKNILEFLQERYPEVITALQALINDNNKNISLTKDNKIFIDPNNDIDPVYIQLLSAYLDKPWTLALINQKIPSAPSV